MASTSNFRQHAYPVSGFHSHRRPELLTRRRNYVASFLKSTRLAHGSITSRALATIRVDTEWIGERMLSEKEETILTQIHQMEQEIETSIHEIDRVKPEALTKEAIHSVVLDAIRDLSRRLKDIEEVESFHIKFGLSVDEDFGLTPDFSENGREISYNPEENVCDFEDVNSRQTASIDTKPVAQVPANQYRLF